MTFPDTGAHEEMTDITSRSIGLLRYCASAAHDGVAQPVGETDRPRTTPPIPKSHRHVRRLGVPSLR